MFYIFVGVSGGYYALLPVIAMLIGLVIYLYSFGLIYAALPILYVIQSLLFVKALGKWADNIG